MSGRDLRFSTKPLPSSKRLSVRPGWWRNVSEKVFAETFTDWRRSFPPREKVGSYLYLSREANAGRPRTRWSGC
jgi:hypothetical protein